MNSSPSLPRLSALAFLYENMRSFPIWLQKLTPGQLEDLAKLMIRWQSTTDNTIEPLEEVEKREVLRAVMNCHGDTLKAAKALKIGKTTIYRKLKQWGYNLEKQLLLGQASVLRGNGRPPRQRYPSPLPSSNEPVTHSR